MLRRLLPVLAFVCLITPSIATAEEISDYTELPSPLVTIAFPEAKTYTRAEKIFPKVSFASTSQIVAVDYVLGDTYVAYDKALPLFDQPLGTTTFSVVTEDISGIISTTTTTFILKTTPQSVSEDIKEASRRGFITKTVIRDRFLRSLESFTDFYTKREKLLAGTDKRKEDRAKTLSDRMEKVLDSEMLDLLKKQDGRTIKKEGADIIREDIEALRAYTEQ